MNMFSDICTSFCLCGREGAYLCVRACVLVCVCVCVCEAVKYKAVKHEAPNGICRQQICPREEDYGHGIALAEQTPMHTRTARQRESAGERRTDTSLNCFRLTASDSGDLLKSPLV